MLRLLRKHKIPVAYVDRLLVRMTIGGMSNRSVRIIVRSNREVYRVWRRNGLPLGYLAPLLKPAQKIFQYVQRPPKETGMKGPNKRSASGQAGE
jgi:glycosyltransferase